MTARLIARLEAIERDGGDGTVKVGGATLSLSSLDKVFFPDEGYTKGDLMRYYVRVAKVILPILRDRPLSQKRFPDGIAGQSFYQQKPPEHTPRGVRVEEVETEDEPRARRFVGGTLGTLLYTIQLGNIGVHPWHSRMRSVPFPDYSVLDLDPGNNVPVERVVEVALWVKEELDALGLHAAVKTSGSTGMHIVVPLPARTTYDVSRGFAERVAARVARAHPREATLERALKNRKGSQVYVDFMQNDVAKTVAAAYCVRAKPGATVSTPLDWSELTAALDPHAFTIETVPARLANRGDLWAAAMKRRNIAKRLLA